MKLNKKEILQIQKNNGDFLMIDEVTNVVPGKSSEGYKYLNNDWFFKFHFPGDPNMPGMLQVEALMQMASIAILTTDNNEGKILYVVKADKLLFKKKVNKGDSLFIKTEIISWNRGYAKAKGKAFVDDQLACSAEFDFVLNEQFKKFKVNQ